MPGTIQQLPKDKDGREGFRLIVPLPPDPATGKRRQKWITLRGVSARDAERELAKHYARGADGIEVKDTQLTTAAYFERWLRDSATGRVAPSSLRRYRELLGLLTPYMGRVKLSALTPMHVQRAYTVLLERTEPRRLSPKTVLNAHRVLHNALKQAHRWGLVSRNVASLVDAPRPAKYNAEMLTPETVAALLRAGDGTPFGRIYRLAPLTGMRLGEILGLRWTDVDLERGVLYIRRSARRQTGKGVVMGNTKTARSSRPVPLASDAVILLKAHRQEQRTATLQMLANYRDDGLVFCKENSEPFDGVYVSHCWRQITRRMGVKARFHDLRHAFATFALKGGVPVKVVSEILGHSTTAITENLYTSVLPGLKEDAVSAVASLLSQATVSDALEVAK